MMMMMMMILISQKTSTAHTNSDLQNLYRRCVLQRIPPTPNDHAKQQQQRCLHRDRNLARKQRERMCAMTVPMQPRVVGCSIIIAARTLDTNHSYAMCATRRLRREMHCYGTAECIQANDRINVRTARKRSATRIASICICECTLATNRTSARNASIELAIHRICDAMNKRIPDSPESQRQLGGKLNEEERGRFNVSIAIKCLHEIRACKSI
mmetsp:Transcript_33811/g.55141  ORF Transcript_33811/g.55141 Transcript_33811/m.55141 type:complete len:212 (-) Transcript_33811:97-732(-)